jgi:hypothetical protein
MARVTTTRAIGAHPRMTKSNHKDGFCSARARAERPARERPGP